MVSKTREVHLLSLLREARAVHKQRMQPFLRELSITEDQWRVLKALNKSDALSENGLDAKSISQQTGIVASSLTGVLGRMERDGLLSRAKCVNDGRAIIIRPTELGKNKLQTFSHIVQDYYSSIERSLGEGKMKTLYSLLHELIVLGENPTEEMRSILVSAAI